MCEKIQEKLLKNVKTKLSKEKQTELNKLFTAKEIEDAIYKLQSGKSPGLDGFPIEFYKKYLRSCKDNGTTPYPLSSMPLGASTMDCEGLLPSHMFDFLPIIFRQGGFELRLSPFYEEVDGRPVRKLLLFWWHPL